MKDKPNSNGRNQETSHKLEALDTIQVGRTSKSKQHLTKVKWSKNTKKSDPRGLDTSLEKPKCQLMKFLIYNLPKN